MNSTALSPHGGDAFQNLLSVMPYIAEEVERFSAEENQRTVLTALLNAEQVTFTCGATETMAPMPM